LGPNLGVFPLDQTRHVGVAKSEHPRLTNGEIISEEFQLFELRSDYGTRGHPHKIFKHHCTCTARSSFFQSELLTFGTFYPLVKLIFLPWSSLNVHLLDTYVFVLCLLFT